MKSFVLNAYNFRHQQPKCLICLFSVDAVYAMAHALHNMLQDVCGKDGILCPAMTPLPSGVDLLKHIRNVSFTSKQLL
jgi:hypothetical protein